jgi:hypothetical protein
MMRSLRCLPLYVQKTNKSRLSRDPFLACVRRVFDLTGAASHRTRTQPPTRIAECECRTETWTAWTPRRRFRIPTRHSHPNQTRAPDHAHDHARAIDSPARAVYGERSGAVRKSAPGGHTQPLPVLSYRTSYSIEYDLSNRVSFLLTDHTICRQS